MGNSIVYLMALFLLVSAVTNLAGDQMAELQLVPEGFQEATFGAGCFWAVEQRFENLPGVLEAISGYAGGDAVNPTYRQVCSGTTGHAEVVRVIFDPEEITYQDLLATYWLLGVPTERFARRDNNTSQYRHIILYHNQEQKNIAEASIRELSEKMKETISVFIDPIEEFYPAEKYHQDYYLKQ